MPSSLYSYRQPALMLGTGAGFSPGLDLAALGKESAQGSDIFIVDGLAFLKAEGAYFAPWGKSPSAEPSRPGPSLIS